MLDALGADLIQKNEDRKDPDEEKKKEEERIKNKNLDKFAITNLTNKLSKNLATKFKLAHKNVDEDGKRVDLLVVDQVTSTSCRLRWTRPKTTYKLHGARIMMREKEVKPGVEGIFRAVVDHTHDAEGRVRTVVGLRPDTEYQFQVASIHDLPQKIPKDYPRDGPELPPRPMIVDGTKCTSSIIRTARANYIKAFFFEDPEDARSRRPTSVPSLQYDSCPSDDGVGGFFFEFEAIRCSAQARRAWSVFFGIYDDKKSTGRDLNAVGSGDQFVLAQQLTISQTDPWELWEEGAVEGDKPRPPCMTGRQCMQLHLPGGLHGGCFAEIEARESRRYRAELYVYHDMEGGKNVEDLPGRCGCRLISFDGRDQYRTSKRARSNKEWERLAVEFIGTPGDKAIIAVQGDKSFGGVVLIDACRIFLLGRDEIGDTCAELEAAVEEPRINKNGVLRVSIVELVNIPRLAGEPPPARRSVFTKSFLGDDAAVLAPSSGIEQASRRWRGGRRDASTATYSLIDPRAGLARGGLLRSR
jgi:hypothetical protein